MRIKQKEQIKGDQQDGRRNCSGAPQKSIRSSGLQLKPRGHRARSPRTKSLWRRRRAKAEIRGCGLRTLARGVPTRAQLKRKQLPARISAVRVRPVVMKFQPSAAFDVYPGLVSYQVS